MKNIYKIYTSRGSLTEFTTEYLTFAKQSYRFKGLFTKILCAMW